MKTLPVVSSLKNLVVSDEVTRSVRNINICLTVGEIVLLENTTENVVRSAEVIDNETFSTYSVFRLV